MTSLQARMDHRAGFLQVMFVCAGVLMQCSDAGTALSKHAAAGSCKLKDLSTLTKSLLRLSLNSYDRANGESLGTWTPGFSELEVQTNSTVNGTNVQCSLLFVVQGLKEILKDQKEDLNPHNYILHKELKDSIFRTNLLKECAKQILRGDCSPAPPPPKIPITYFDRKQWSHTLLETAGIYISWLEHKITEQTNFDAKTIKS
ncbi:uncharacterized protein [Takifugu rubripes]|uniref:uncharacterized protein n=1 Tax=Takifugu rubripes TaxID=31033 RepID=UPI0011458912|nr:uncharacterized protein LOC115247618 [Takifugu rubripes]